MSNYLRARATGACYFFTVKLARPGDDLLLRHIDLLRAAYRATVSERPIRCDAFVVLPDHLHAIWTLPPGDEDFSTRWGALKARFTRAVKSHGRVGLHPTGPSALVGCNPTLPRSRSKIEKGDGGIWQRRFWEHMIRDEADYTAHLAYCWRNPVKHGLAKRASAWPYSSIHRDIRLGLVGSEWRTEDLDGRFGE
ncbi:REP-associated tyrosine transposase [Actibacterium ureilyticum]|uniref:REP-associated tyrosine transposase n=1 Tax=Actibacterium ureilyticum TaxID=1590614 RepID=UPI000BAAC659|nr:transposase [Actibacterium ureilyticum]